MATFIAQKATSTSKVSNRLSSAISKAWHFVNSDRVLIPLGISSAAAAWILASAYSVTESPSQLVGLALASVIALASVVLMFWDSPESI